LGAPEIAFGRLVVKRPDLKGRAIQPNAVNRIHDSILSFVLRRLVGGRELHIRVAASRRFAA
jgi:hypothetical protein